MRINALNMSISSDLAGLVRGVLDIEKQVKYAASRAVNNVTFQANARLKSDLRATVKGGPTPYTLNAFRIKKSTPQTLYADISLREDSPGKARTYIKTIGHLFTGGQRTYKRMEGAFRRIGALNPGMIMVPPRTTSWANPLDTYGNPSRGLIVTLISYFEAFQEGGFRANATDITRAKRAKGTKKSQGVTYFISKGKGMYYGKMQHLAPGIWAKRSTHGFDVAPVFLFVRSGQWRKLLDLKSIEHRVIAERWRPEFDQELYKALLSAKRG